MAEQPPFTEPTAGSPGTQIQPSPFRRLGNALVLSRAAFRLPFRSWDWIIPLVIASVVAVGSAQLLHGLTQAKQVELRRTMIQNSARLSEDQKTEALERLDQKEGVAGRLFSTLFGPIAGVFLSTLVLSAIFLLIVRFMLAGTVTFGTLWLITSLSWGPRIIGTILFTILALTRSSIDISFGVAAFLSADLGIARDLLRGVLDLFDIWMIVVQIVGIMVAARLTAAKAAIAVLGPWILWWLLQVGAAVVTKQFAGGL